MITFSDRISSFDVLLTRWMARHGVKALRASLGIIIFWFGLLKFFPGLSPAEGLATITIGMLTFGLVSPGMSIPVLCSVGMSHWIGPDHRTFHARHAVSPLGANAGSGYAIVFLSG